MLIEKLVRWLYCPSSSFKRGDIKGDEDAGGEGEGEKGDAPQLLGVAAEEEGGNEDEFVTPEVFGAPAVYEGLLLHGSEGVGEETVEGASIPVHGLDAKRTMPSR